MDNGDFITAIKLLSKSVQLRRKALYKGHPDLGKSADKLAQCYAFLGTCASKKRNSLIIVFTNSNFTILKENLKSVKRCLKFR